MGGAGGRPDAKDVLVVDDEQALRLLCRVNLELDGHTVREAGTVAAALAELDAAVPDVLLLDLHVGHDNGLDLLDEVRRRGLATRVILLSGSAEIEAELRERVDGVLGKPFELSSLADAVAGGR